MNSNEPPMGAKGAAERLYCAIGPPKDDQSKRRGRALVIGHLLGRLLRVGLGIVSEFRRCEPEM